MLDGWLLVVPKNKTKPIVYYKEKTDTEIKIHMITTSVDTVIDLHRRLGLVVVSTEKTFLTVPPAEAYTYALDAEKHIMKK